MTARLLFFGSLREVGADLQALPPGLATVGELRAWILRARPNIGAVIQSARARIAIDGVIIQSDAVSLEGVREIAFLPPMSGG